MFIIFRLWEIQGFRVELSSVNLLSENCTNNIFNEIDDSKSVEGIYVIATDANKSNIKEYNKLMNKLDLISRKLCPNLK